MTRTPGPSVAHQNMYNEYIGSDEEKGDSYEYDGDASDVSDEEPRISKLRDEYEDSDNRPAPRRRSNHRRSENMGFVDSD